MTQSLPNGLSSEDLQRMLAEARPEPIEECTCDNTPDPSDNDYQEQIMKVADKYVDLATDEITDPMVHKAMLVLICNNFINFHNRMAESMLEDGESEMAAAWSRDAGKFQAMLNILGTVVCGSNDFLASE